MRELFLGADPVPVGSRIGDLIHAVGVGARDTASALIDLQRLVDSGGGSLDNVAQVSFFVGQRELLPTINPAWVRTFPDERDRPTYKFMIAELPVARPVHLEFFAVVGQRRQLLHLPTVAHTNPIPMGVRIGRYLFSSRVLPYDPTTGQPPDGAARQTDSLFRNVRALLDVGHMRAAQITQGRLFLADRADLAVAKPLWKALVADAPAPPALHVTPYALAPALRVMLEFIAVC